MAFQQCWISADVFNGCARRQQVAAAVANVTARRFAKVRVLVLIFGKRSQLVVARPLKIHKPAAETDKTKRQDDRKNDQASSVFFGIHTLPNLRNFAYRPVPIGS